MMVILPSYAAAVAFRDEYLATPPSPLTAFSDPAPESTDTDGNPQGRACFDHPLTREELLWIQAQDVTGLKISTGDFNGPYWDEEL